MAKTQWHPAFCAAVRLELKENATLEFTDEFNLTEKPLEVDMLVVNKPADTHIDHVIGEFFKGHNLLEYKSPTDHGFNEYAVGQALSYAYYYCDKYQTWDVTVSLVVSKAHFNLLKWFDSQGIRYEKRHDGVYTIYGFGFLPMQVIITEELDGDDARWLSVLTDRLTEESAREFVETVWELKESEEKRLAGAISQVVLSANKTIFDEIKEGVGMTWMEYLKPEIEQYAREHAEEYAKERLKERDIEHIKAMIRHGDDNDYIKLIIGCTDEEIDELRKAMQ